MPNTDHRFAPSRRDGNGHAACCGCPRTSGNGQDGFLSVANASPCSSVSLEAGTKLDRYIIRARLGRGRIGELYLATDTVTGNDLAIKVVEVGPNKSAFAEQLKREKAAYDAIQDHRHVLKVFDLHEVSLGGAQLLILGMEYADGGTFRRWLDEHRDDHAARAEQGLTLFRQICRGVGAAHSAGLAHLDLKPENVLLVRGQCKVADFGAASFRDYATGAMWRFPSSNQPPTGTPTYMSPEHFTAAHPDDLDHRADIYALGVIPYELLHVKARPPFGGSYERLRELHTSVLPPPPPGASELHCRVVARCLSKDPAARYPQVTDLLDELDGVSAPADPPEPNDPIEVMWRRACVCIPQRCFPQAQQLCARILRLRPDYDHAQMMLDDLHGREQQAQRLYDTIEQGLAGGSLEDLTALLREAVELYPNHPAGRVAQIGLVSRSRRYRTTMRRGAAAFLRGAWDEAAAAFQQAVAADPGSSSAAQAADLTSRVLQHIEESRRHINEATHAQDWSRAQALARCLDEYVEGIAHSNSHSQRGIRS